MDNEKELVLISMCALGIPCQYRARSFKKKIIDRYMSKYILIPICPEQLGGMSTPRVACTIKEGKILGKDGKEYTKQYQKGAQLTLKLAKLYGITKAYMKRGSPSCGKNGVTRKLLEENGIKVFYI